MVPDEGALWVVGRVDDHAHAALAVGALAAEDPDGVGVVDEDVVDRGGGFVAGDGNEAGAETWALRSGETLVFADTGRVEAGFRDSVVLALVSFGVWR